jgi:hypothetical protein
MIFLSPDDGVFHVDRETFERAAKARFDDAEVFDTEPDETDVSDVSVYLDPPGEPAFQIWHDEDGQTIRTDGTEEQAAEVAVWVRSLLPDDPGGRIWMCDQMFNGHVELAPGMTADDVKASWVDHSEVPPDVSWTETPS